MNIDLSYSLSAKIFNEKYCTNFLQQCTKVWDFSEHLFIYKNKIPLFKLPLGLTPSLSLQTYLAGTVLPIFLLVVCTSCQHMDVFFKMNTKSQDIHSVNIGVSRSQYSVTQSCEHYCQPLCPHCRWAPHSEWPGPARLTGASSAGARLRKKTLLLFKEEDEHPGI